MRRYNSSPHETPVWMSRPAREQPPVEVRVEFTDILMKRIITDAAARCIASDQ